jgi:hypothetical protein
MTQTQTLQKIQRRHWKTLEQLMKRAYREGLAAGRMKAHGQGRPGRTIRADATVEGLVRLIEQHFGLDRYHFDVRLVHRGTRRHLPLHDSIGKYRVTGG